MKTQNPCRDCTQSTCCGKKQKYQTCKKMRLWIGLVWDMFRKEPKNEDRQAR